MFDLHVPRNEEQGLLSHNIFIVDSHPLIRKGFRALVEQEADFRVCGDAPSIAEAMERIPGLDPDLIIADLTSSIVRGVELIQCLHKKHPGLPILVSCCYERELYGQQVMRAGAIGYIQKCDFMDGVLNVIRQLLRPSASARC